MVKSIGFNPTESMPGSSPTIEPMETILADLYQSFRSIVDALMQRVSELEVKTPADYDKANRLLRTLEISRQKIGEGVERDLERFQNFVIQLREQKQRQEAAFEQAKLELQTKVEAYEEREVHEEK